MALHRILPLTLALAWAGVGHAEALRIATYDTELGQKGPGVLISKILGDDETVAAVVAVITEARPDVLLLNGFDWDAGNHALSALAARLADAGLDLRYQFAAMPNSGLESGLDLDGNGKLGEARDSQGYGNFTGAGGMAVLSRLPLGEVRDFSAFLWADLPGALLPEVDGRPFPSAEAQEGQRLASVAHWDVPVMTDSGPLHLLAYSATTPVFDGPEDQNGRRNADESLFWLHLIDGDLPFAAPEGPVVVIGNANLDPEDGDGRREAIRALLDDPRFVDPKPASPGGAAAANPDQAGDPALDTADWTDPSPGNLRVDYVLPDARLTVTDAGVVWPAPDDPFAQVVEAASRRRLVWVDIETP
ncbi:MAG: endonuclease/exonuclease/phosphatase family protein [Maritimibacter sp.]|nr:endonuclease/exonuclease/phosphatase family protein [Maritimibacter sp.]